MADKKNLPTNGEDGATSAFTPAIDPLTQINIDGTNYDLRLLPDEAKQIIYKMRFTDDEIARLRGVIGILSESRQNYGTQLKELLPKPGTGTRQ